MCSRSVTRIHRGRNGCYACQTDSMVALILNIDTQWPVLLCSALSCSLSPILPILSHNVSIHTHSGFVCPPVSRSQRSINLYNYSNLFSPLRRSSRIHFLFELMSFGCNSHEEQKGLLLSESGWFELFYKIVTVTWISEA